MQIDILTLFPGMFVGPLTESILKRAVAQNLVTINVHDLRGWATDKHRTTDDRPYGGGPGMVMMVEPIARALKDLGTAHVILTSAKGTLFTESKAKKLAKLDRLIFIAGHYEGVDQRVADNLVDEEYSIGEYVLTGGELPVMVMVDSIVRLIPGVLGDPESLTEESFNKKGFLEYPHYTRPESFKGLKVPKILLEGHHAKIEKWRQTHSKNRSRI